MARPSKLNEELIELMHSKLKKGLPISSCCDLLLITHRSHDNWMQLGEQDVENENYDSLYAQYFLTIKKGRCEFEELAIDDIKTGRPGWQGMAWVLERTNNKYMPRQEFDAGPDAKVNVIIGGKVKDLKSKDLTMEDNR